MNVVLTSAEIDLLWSTKTAQENYVYVCEDGFLYKGQKDGSLQRVPNTNYDDWVAQRNANQTLPFRNKTIIQGTRLSDGDIVDIKVSDDGKPLIEVSSSALPTGAATESKQDTGNLSLSNLDTNLGAKGNDAASSDTGTFSLIALFKRALQKFTRIEANQTNGTQVVQVSAVNSTVKTKIVGPTTAFGELSIAKNTAFVQNTGVYEFMPNNFREYTSLSGTTGVTNRMFTTTCGTTIYGYGAIQSFRSLNYNAGQSGMARFTALFQNNVANHWSGVGLVNLSDELSFGYDGTTFGIWHRSNGVAEVRTITVTGASGGSTNLTLTLNSVAYTIPLTSGTTAHNAYQISAWLNANQSVWSSDQVGSTIIISAESDGAKSGTYTYSHATSTGAITQNKAGVTKTSTHIPRTNWNRDTASWIDPTKGNVYQVIYPYLGFGDLEFYVKSTDDSGWLLVHVIEYQNLNTLPSVRQPSLRFGIYSASVGSTTDVTVQCASVALFVNGDVFKTRNPRAVKNTQSVTSSFTNILTLRNRRTYNYIYNQVEIEPISLSLASESTKNVEIEIRTNPVFAGDTNFITTGTNLVGDIDTTANTYSNGTLLAAFTLSSNGNRDINLEAFNIRIPPTLQVCISARVTSGAASNVTAALTYYEDI